MDPLLGDLRYALRQMRRRPAFTVIAALSLAIGVGANTAIFSAINALLLRPVPGVADPERVVEVGRSNQGRGFDTFAYPDYEDLRGEVTAFDRTAAFTLNMLSFSRGEEGERVTASHVSPAYFDVMGLSPALGRFFTPDEDLPGSVPRVAVLSHRFWTDRLGADPDVLGSTVRLNREAFEVVGVLPEAFRGHVVAFSPDVYLPFRAISLTGGNENFTSRGSSWHQMVARLRPGATPAEADVQVKAVYARLAEAYPETNRHRSGSVLPLGLVPGGGRGPVRAFLGALMGLVALILLVTCTNVAGMFLARASGREREIAVRLALGSGRGRLVRQLLVEALVVFALGGAAGALLGATALGLVPLESLPLPITVRIDFAADPLVLAFALSATLGTGVLFGLLPALGATRLELVASLKDDGSARRARSSFLRRSFVAGQVGFSLVLLVGAGLFVRALQRAASVETGFDASGAYMTDVALDMEGYDEETGLAFQERLVERVAAFASVEHAALAVDLPLDLGSHGTAAYPEGWDEEDRVSVDFNVVSPGYFAALRIPVLSGRAIGAEDHGSSEPVAVVSREFAERVWPGEDPLGRRFGFGGRDEVLRTVVGVVADVKNQFLTEAPKPFVYIPLAQYYRPSTYVVVRADGGIATVAPALRAAILDVDPSLSLTPVVALDRYTALGILPQRLAAGITGSLGLLALLLSGLGVYGVVAFATTRRTREIGIRMALGAGRGSVVGMVVRGGLGLALPGLVLGGAAAVGMGYLLRSFLLGLSPTDPITLGVVGSALVGVVLLASAVPARRASAVEPVEALRSE